MKIPAMHIKRAFMFARANWMLTTIAVIALSLIIWTWGASVKEKWDSWRYGAAVEKLDDKIEASEVESKAQDAEANVINEEGNRKFDEYSINKAETERLRRELSSTRRTIDALRKAVVASGHDPVATNASDVELCKRAKSLDIRCDLPE